MRIAAAILALFLSMAPAFAADTEGVIKAIDADKMTITLDDGKSYKLPAEIDVSAISTGMDVVIAYRQVEDGVRQITDMVLPE